MPPGGTRFSWRHHRAYGVLMMALYQALREDHEPPLGRSIQRFVLRLGEDAFMPDLQVFRRDRLHRLREYYFDGPADLVIEVVFPGHEAQDREVKARLYADGGVPEYWVIDPAARRAEVLTLSGGSYVAQAPGPDGRHRSTVLAGLTLDPARLWACLDDPQERRELEDHIVFVEPSDISVGPSTASDDRERWTWEWRPYMPPVGPRATPISFEQFIDWCPDAKFELLEGLPHIGGWDGTRKVLGLLLMTFHLLDDEYAYEMLAHLRDEGDHALWGTLVEELKAARPDLYAHSAPYYLEWQIADALAAGHLDRLPALAAALAETAGDDLDQFYYSRDRLAYHGHLALLAETMARAWPLVRESDKYLPGADEEFASEAQQLAMLAYLERTATPRADGPALLAAVEQFGPVDFPEALADQIALITGQADRPWERADDSEDTRIERLGFRFQGELAHRWGMPLGRAELARVALLTYIAERRDPDSSIAQAVRRPKGKHKVVPPTAADLLCPDRESLDRYLAQKLNFISFQLIDAAVTLEAVPAWLHFLHDQGLHLPDCGGLWFRGSLDKGLTSRVLAARKRVLVAAYASTRSASCEASPRPQSHRTRCGLPPRRPRSRQAFLSRPPQAPNSRIDTFRCHLSREPRRAQPLIEPVM